MLENFTQAALARGGLRGGKMAVRNHGKAEVARKIPGLLGNICNGFCLKMYIGAGLFWLNEQLELSMNRMKCLLFLSALTSAFGVAVADDAYAELDIIVRDFPVTHPDFENFQEEAYGKSPWSDWSYSGYNDNSTWLERRADYATYGCGNESTPIYGAVVGIDGYPMDATLFTNLPSYLQTVSSSSGSLYYGEFSCAGTIYRGYYSDYVPIGCSENWSQMVYVTPNMVSPYLTFDASLGDDMMYEPIISRYRYACDNVYFEQWYSDDNDWAKRTNTVLQLPRVEGTTNEYEVDYNWNNGGYFPLDVVDDNNLRTGAFEGTNGYETAQYGPQSLSIFCPPYSYKYADSQQDYEGNSTYGLCLMWLNYGGPKVEGAAEAAANYYTAQGDNIGLKHLRNYGLTMMGYAKFKYKEGNGEIFEFIGDDDMWIYIDGVLVVDLGGTHLAAYGKVEMDYLAENGHGCHTGEPLADSTASGQNCDLDDDGTWSNGSWHHLHFFYADRQTDGSNMKIHTTLSELAASRYGQPAISEVTITPEEGNWVVTLTLNTELSDETVAAIQAAAAAGEDYILSVGAYPVIVSRTDEDGNVTYYVYIVTSFEKSENQSGDGVNYTMTGYMYELNSDGTVNTAAGAVTPSSGDAFSFNYYNDGSDVESVEDYINGITNTSWINENPITSTGGLSVTGSSYGSASLEVSISENFTVVDKTITRPAFDVTTMLNAQGLSEGDDLSKRATGEIQLTTLPAEAGEYEYGVDSWLNQTSSADPSKTNQQYLGSSNGGAAYGASIKTYSGTSSEGYCYQDGNGVESCTSISFWVSRPFRVNVRVFDHLGHFISQYTESVSNDEMKALAEATGLHDGSGTCASAPSFSGIVATVKLYPISQTGRKIATGPYIYQVALIKQAWDDGANSYCFYYAGAYSPVGEEAYERSSFDKTLGYRRTSN